MVELSWDGEVTGIKYNNQGSHTDSVYNNNYQY